MFEEVRNPVLLRLLLDGVWSPPTGKHWCGYCIDPSSTSGWISSESVRQHVKQDHDVSREEQESGYDYMTSEELVLALQRKGSRDAELRYRFSLRVASIRTVEDFLTDCG